MIYDIKDRDADAHRMKVCFQKMDNFLRTFALDYFRMEQEFANSKYGSEWPFRRWLLLKVGVSEDTAHTLFKARERALAGEEREANEQAMDQRRKEKWAEKRQKQAEVNKQRIEKEFLKRRKAEEKAAIEADREAARKRKAAEKAAKEEKKRKARKQEIDRAYRARKKQLAASRAWFREGNAQL